MGQDIRQPKQGRSIETKNKIIQAGFELFSKDGYHATNTAEIAKYAGVSTGIVYGYFKDKRDILLEVLDIYVQNAFSPVMNNLNELTSIDKLDKVVEDIINSAIKVHESNANIHEALHSMSHLDKEINDKFIYLEDHITNDIAEMLQKLKLGTDNITEKVHFAMDIVQSFAHEYVYDHHSYINYDDMKKIVTKTVVSLFK